MLEMFMGVLLEKAIDPNDVSTNYWRWRVAPPECNIVSSNNVRPLSLSEKGLFVLEQVTAAAFSKERLKVKQTTPGK
ncbi:hypothetical protein TNCV_1721581 [Trichonephila clavipes]|nr:hypothetical protein TNCV_1721581 [Trichonephila clavipes]